MSVRTKTTIAVSSLLLTSQLLLACSESSKSSANVEPNLEIFSWWTQPGEVEALDALLSIYADHYPSVEVTNAAALDANTQRERLKARMDTGDPPDSFQAVSGIDTLRWTVEGKLANLDSIAEAEDWSKSFPKAVLDIVSEGGHLYGLPLNIERDNNLYYSIAMLEKEGVTPPKTLDEFYAACETLRSKDITPLAVPAAGWVLALVAIETLMPTVVGGEFYLDYFAGKADPKDPKVGEWVDAFAKVLECSDVATSTSSWGDGASRVFEGSAAMLVMGDWAKGFFEALDVDGRDKWVADEDFGVVAGLGSDGYFTFNSAVFTLPKGVPHPKAARAFIEVVGSREGQAAFNPVKGSLPARTDVDLTDYDAMVQRAGDDFRKAADAKAKLLPGYASLTPNEYQTLLNPALLVFAVGGARARDLAPDEVPAAEEVVEAFDRDYLLKKLEVAYELLKN